MSRSARGAQSPRPPSRLTRRIAALHVRLGVIFGLLTLLGLVALILNIALMTSAFAIVVSVGLMLFCGPMAYTLGVEVPRNVRDWDAALEERQRVTRPASR